MTRRTPPGRMPRVPATARPRHVHKLTMHERQVLMMYVAATPELRLQIDAALWETNRTLETQDAMIRASDRFHDRSSATVIWPFRAAHEALHGKGGDR